MSSDHATLEGLRIDRPTPTRRRRPSWITPTIIATIVIVAGGWWWIGHRTGEIAVATAPVRTQA
ncbi:MAG: efflux RND transporter periplasmic adaptor subunit, partial [Chthoniobacteraceae bacterium]